MDAPIHIGGPDSLRAGPLFFHGDYLKDSAPQATSRPGAAGWEPSSAR
jgi:hypothetical protein